ncbi:plasmid pRiA4b ORF-3 family protein [Shinella curvata]|uniref:Plasmid pRiA4b ORF-3 family protein n=1 Tax=Shinella curvata TaxID=1817964 RepID=A0ABT8XL37_9HYPH|nr:plasmid pRiA4b ORF-3 family protein [Shinella curvata]MCJ8056823.1 plasmid pRiA4b ORF-3 family protein [Shinella curvata]MDO6124158.1 plasmid pRiA4b ORF-3 family protein [Shinella curvata]
MQAALNWWNYHLYEFRLGGLRYGDVEVLTEDATDDDPRVFDQTRFACWTSSKVRSSATTMISGMAGGIPSRSRIS